MESRDVLLVARGGLLLQSAADRLEGLEGVEVRLGMVEDGGLGEVQVVEGEGVDHAVSGVEGPVRDVLVSGGGVGVAGVLLRGPVLSSLQTVQLSGAQLR